MMRWGRIMLGVGLVAAAAVPNLAAAQSVFLVCTGSFSSERAVGETVERVAFDGAMYLTVELDGDDGRVERMRLVPVKRTPMMEMLDLSRSPASSDGTTVFRMSDETIRVQRRQQSGPMIHAVVGDNPRAVTPVHLHEVALEMNRFSGAIEIDWQWHQVRDFRPAAAIRTVKKRYSDRKRFAADCDLMKERLF